MIYLTPSATTMKRTTMNPTALCPLATFVLRRKSKRPPLVQRASLCVVRVPPCGCGVASRTARGKASPYVAPSLSVRADEASGILTLRTPYYVIEQD